MFYLIFFLLTINIYFAQNETWKNFTSFSNVTDIEISSEENFIWAATEGGIYSYNGNDYLTLTKTEGLSSQFITALNIDKNKNVWIGTKEGYINILINSSDGNIRKIFDIYTSNNTSKSINSITSEGDTIFVSTDFGLSLISATSLNFIETATKFGEFNSKTKVLYSVKDMGKIYVSTTEGLAIEKDSAISLSTPDAWLSLSFVNLYPDYPTCTLLYNDTLFIGTNAGLYFLTNNNSVEYFELINKNILQLIKKDNSLIILTSNSLYQYRNGIFTTLYNSEYDLRKAKISNNKFYFATENGTLLFDGNNETLIKPSSPEKNVYSEISVDKEGVVWIATGKDPTGVGIFYFDGEIWRNLNKHNTSELSSDYYYKVYTDNSNVTYFSNWGAGFISIDNGIIKNFNAENTGMEGIPGYPDYLVTAGIKNDSKRNLWVVNLWSGNNTPINVMTSDSVWYHFEQPLFSPSDKEWFSNLVIDQYGTKWFTNIDGHKGLFYFNENGTFENTDDDSWGWLTNNNGLSSSFINDLAIDKNGELWIATNTGLNIITDTQNPGRISEIYSMRTKNIRSVFVDPLNNKWVGTDDGVYYLSSDGFTVISQYNKNNSPLPSDKILDIGFNEDTGEVFFVTDYGITMLRTDAVAPLKKFGELFVFPNPFIPGENDVITIDQLATNSRIKIFTIDGKLVASSESGQIVSPGGRIAYWNGFDLYSKKVSSGIYIIVAFNEDGTEYAKAKLAVIRK